MKILKVEGMTNYGTYANVEVVLEDGTIGEVFVGGSVECYFDKQKIKVFVKRPPITKPLTS